MTKEKQDAARASLERSEGIIMAHVHASQGRSGASPRIGMFNTFVGRNGGRLEVVLDVEEAALFAAWLETRVSGGDK